VPSYKWSELSQANTKSGQGVQKEA